jgi:hypothetical protein
MFFVRINLKSQGRLTLVRVNSKVIVGRAT